MPANPNTAGSQNFPGTGIVHLGLGAFFRAFGVPWICEAMEAEGGDWNITGVSLRSSSVRDAMKPLGYSYTAMELGPEKEICRTIDGVKNVLVASEDPEAVLSSMADPAIKIVSLTITEKGYCHNPATGRLNLDDADIQDDIARQIPKTAPGFIVRALQRRRQAGHAPFTVLSCDNLPQNGDLTRGVILEFARQIDGDLANWIAAEGTFPSTMVDRIVPATKLEDIDRCEQLTGRRDEAVVVHEPFRQWVIEDSFVNGQRPAFEKVGVQLVDNVAPFEHMKLRMLNGTHSAMAYLGYLAGHETIAQVAGDPVFEYYVKKLWSAEIIPSIEAPPGVDLDTYARELFSRYTNPAIRHLTWQIAMDGSQKLPQRILATLSDNLDEGRDSSGLMLAVAAWMRYVGGTDENGSPIDVRDPMAERLKTISDQAESGQIAAALINVGEIFPAELTTRMEHKITRTYNGLVAKGARAAAEEIK